MRLLAAGLFLGSTVAAAQDVSPLEPITHYHTGKVLQSACTTAELVRLKAATTRLAGRQNPSGAWSVAKAMLCNPRPPIGSMPQLVAQEQYGLNEDPGPSFGLVPREAIAGLGGRAYGVVVERAGAGIRFNYNTAGVCVGGFALRFVAGHWLLVESGEACD